MMEIADCGIKCTEDIEEAIKDYYPSIPCATEELQRCCRVYGERFYPLLCELAAKKILDTPSDV